MIQKKCLNQPLKVHHVSFGSNCAMCTPRWVVETFTETTLPSYRTLQTNLACVKTAVYVTAGLFSSQVELGDGQNDPCI